MRLIDTDQLQFHEFYGTCPPYAILSHTWGSQEAVYEDVHDSSIHSRTKFGKVYHCSAEARKAAIDYIWVDTCCIDKRSSSELTEAVNSMFQWFQGAEVCYVYLEDVDCNGSEDWQIQFQKAKWNSRMWTLQELLAPRKVVFFSSDWTELGTKDTLRPLISATTGIPPSVLTTGDFHRFSVAQRFSWAANRQCTRVEDMAYSLMCLFDVNMPLLYGEGQRAFVRLQEEIIKRSDDITIFAWRTQPASFSSFQGLLASAPEDFHNCQNVLWSGNQTKMPFQVTNMGIQLNTTLIPQTHPNEFIVPLLGVSLNHAPSSWVGIYLRRVSESIFSRIKPGDLAMVPRNAALESSTTNHPWKILNLARRLALRPSKITATDTIYVKSVRFMPLADHSRADGVQIRLLTNRLHVELRNIKKRNNGIERQGELVSYSFSGPPMEQGVEEVLFKINRQEGLLPLMGVLDANKQWGDFITVEDSWVVRGGCTDLEHKLQCRMPGQGLIEMMLTREIVEGNATIVLSVDEG
jgi:hypothetical protein